MTALSVKWVWRWSCLHQGEYHQVVSCGKNTCQSVRVWGHDQHLIQSWRPPTPRVLVASEEWTPVSSLLSIGPMLCTHRRQAQAGWQSSLCHQSWIQDTALRSEGTNRLTASSHTYHGYRFTLMGNTGFLPLNIFSAPWSLSCSLESEITPLL